MKILIRVVVAVMVLLAVAMVSVKRMAQSKLATPLDVQSKLTPGQGDVERGRSLATSTLICTECHAEDFGGKVMIDDLAMGQVVAPNISGLQQSLAELDLAIRHGVRADKTPLVLMPAVSYTVVSARDMRDLAAFLNTVPAVQRALPKTSLGPLGSALMLAGEVHVFAWHLDHEKMDNGSSDLAPLERGPYLLTVSGCRACHGDALEGAPTPPGNPPAPAITAAALATWNEEGFNRAMREGKGRDGHALKLMPWRAYAALTAEDLHTIWSTLNER